MREERDLKLMAKRLHTPHDFPVIRKESTFEFLRKENTNKAAKDNLSKLHELFLQKRHIKQVSKITRALLKELRFLESRFPNFGEVICFIEENLTLQYLGNKRIKLDPIYIWGEPGIGKTEFINSLSKVLNIGMEKYNASQMNGAMVLAGSEPQWSDSAPGLITQAMMRSDTANFIFFLDELEKVHVSGNGGDPLNALYDLLEERSACRFIDQAYTGAVLFDASLIIFIAAGNETRGIHPALLSRFNVFEVPIPSIEQFKTIIKHVYRRMLDENDWGPHFDYQVSDDVVEAMIKEGQSVRDIKKSFKGAFSRAYKNGRCFLTPEDIVFFDVKTVKMGFY